MSIKSWMPFFTTVCNDARIKRIVLVLYYFAILISLILMYGKGDFSAPSFVYQNF